MNHWDRLQEQPQGLAPDCVPVSLWRHWPGEDEDPRALAMAIMGWQRRYDFDLVRYMPSDAAAAEHWGARTRYRGNAFGLREIERWTVTDPGQWSALRPSGAADSALMACNEGLERLAQALGGTVPIVQSVTSPLVTAWQLAGDAILEHMRTAPDVLDAGLKAIADVAAAFACRALESGACGIALVTAWPGAHPLADADRRRFGQAWDLRVLDAVRGTSQLDMVCAGSVAVGDMTLSYPVSICQGRGSASAAGAQFAGIVAGGLDPDGVLGRGARAEVDQEVCALLDSVSGMRAMIAADGPCRLETPEANIDGVVDAVRRRTNRLPEEAKP